MNVLLMSIMGLKNNIKRIRRSLDLPKEVPAEKLKKISDDIEYWNQLTSMYTVNFIVAKSDAVTVNHLQELHYVVKNFWRHL